MECIQTSAESPDDENSMDWSPTPTTTTALSLESPRIQRTLSQLFISLPPEMQEEIMSHLTVRDHHCLRNTCRLYRSLDTGRPYQKGCQQKLLYDRFGIHHVSLRSFPLLQANSTSLPALECTIHKLTRAKCKSRNNLGETCGSTGTLERKPNWRFNTMNVTPCEAGKLDLSQLNKINELWKSEASLDASFKTRHGKEDRVCGECVQELHDGYKRLEVNLAVARGMQRLCHQCEDVYTPVLTPATGRPRKDAQKIRKGVCNCNRAQWDSSWICVPCTDQYNECLGRAGLVLKEQRLRPADPTIPFLDNNGTRFDDTMNGQYSCLCGQIEDTDSVEFINPFGLFFERPVGIWVCMFCDQVCCPRESFRFGSTWMTSEKPGNTYWTPNGPTFRRDTSASETPRIKAEELLSETLGEQE